MVDSTNLRANADPKLAYRLYPSITPFSPDKIVLTGLFPEENSTRDDVQLTCVYRNKPQRASGTPFYEVRMFPPADKIRLYPASDVVVSNPISNIRPDGMLTKRVTF